MATIDEDTIKTIENTLIYIKEQEKELKDIESFKKDLKNDFFIKNNKAVKDNSTASYNHVKELSQ